MNSDEVRLTKPIKPDTCCSLLTLCRELRIIIDCVALRIRGGRAVSSISLLGCKAQAELPSSDYLEITEG